MSFNEGFCIPVPANALAVCALQLSVCSLGPQAQEELLVGLKRSISFRETEAGPVNDTAARIRSFWRVRACWTQHRCADIKIKMSTPVLPTGHGPGRPGRL